MSAERPRHSGLRLAVALAAAGIGAALAIGAASFLLHGRHWFVRQGYPEAAAIALGAAEITAGLLLAVPRTRTEGAAALFAVLGWAAGFHFALRQPAGGLFAWMAAVAAVALAGRFATERDGA